MSVRILFIISALAVGIPWTSASAQVSFRAAKTVDSLCSPGTAWFDGGCRDDGWTLDRFGDVETAHGSRIHRADSLIELIDSFGDDRAQISWVTSVAVDEDSADRDAPRLTSLSDAEASGPATTAAALRSPTGGAPVTVAPGVDPSATRGGYLVSRTVELSRAFEGGDERIRLIERRLDTGHPLGPRLVEVQDLSFDPTSQVPVCGEEGPCVLAYTATPLDCLPELMRSIAAYSVYMRKLMSGSEEEIVEAGWAAARAYRAYADCIIYGG